MRYRQSQDETHVPKAASKGDKQIANRLTGCREDQRDREDRQLIREEMFPEGTNNPPEYT